MLEQMAGPDVELQGKEVVPTEPPSKEHLLSELDRLAESIRALIVEAKRLKRENLEPYQDPIRSLSVAQTNLQTGFLWLRRAIEQPKTF